MSRDRRHKKKAATVPGRAFEAAFQGSLQNPDSTSAEHDSATTRTASALAAMLARLGLNHSAGEGDTIILCGQQYNLRTATAMARQLGGRV